jgi:hypothetical protein
MTVEAGCPRTFVLSLCIRAAKYSKEVIQIHDKADVNALAYKVHNQSYRTVTFMQALTYS